MTSRYFTIPQKKKCRFFSIPYRNQPSVLFFLWLKWQLHCCRETAYSSCSCPRLEGLIESTNQAILSQNLVQQKPLGWRIPHFPRPSVYKMFQDRHSQKNTWPLALNGNELILLETSHPKLEDNRVLIYISWLLTFSMRTNLCVLSTYNDTSFLVGTWNRETRSEDTRRSPAHSCLFDTVCLNFQHTKGGHRVIKLSQRNILLKTMKCKGLLGVTQDLLEKAQDGIQAYSIGMRHRGAEYCV